jgi:hypothetical protein
MAHGSSPYIDGNRLQVFRTVNGTGTNIDPHTNVVAPHDSFTTVVSGTKFLNVEPQRYIEGSLTYTVATGVNNLVPVFQCHKLKYLSVKIVSDTVVLTDFITVVTVNSTFNIWDAIANSDYHYTSGQGENTGNPMILVRKCSPVNPRTLTAGASTWILFNVEPYAAIYFNVTATVAGNLTTYYYGSFN